MSLVEHARYELGLAGKDEEGMQEKMNKNILEMVEIFANQNHSGFSADYAIRVLERLLKFKPLTKLTGEKNEWNPADGNIEQNKRCFSVFRKNEDNSTAHMVGGKIFSLDGGETWFSNKDSSIQVIFPFVVPDKPEYIILEKELQHES